MEVVVYTVMVMVTPILKIVICKMKIIIVFGCERRETRDEVLEKAVKVKNE